MLTITFTYIHLYHATVSEIEHQLEQLQMFHGAKFVDVRQTQDGEHTMFTLSTDSNDYYLYVHHTDEG
jgi:hypothetical protein